MPRSIRAFALIAGLVIAGWGLASGAADAKGNDDVIGHVYVNNNTTGVNTISGFDRHTDGTLTPIEGSPFQIGGAGDGGASASQGALQLSSDGRYLLAVDPGSNQISVVRIRPDGSLRLVGPGPVSSGGSTPVSIAVNGDLVYVANNGAADRNYTGFRLNPGGQLRAIEGSTVALTGPAAPVDILFNSTGTLLAATRFGPSDTPSLIDTFAVGADGKLTAAPSSPFAAEGKGPFGSAFRPTDPNQLFVTNAHNGAVNGTVSAFDVAADGALTSIAGSPFLNGQAGTCWVAISPDGNFLFAVNTGSNSISRYSIATDGGLSFLGNTPMTNPVAPAGLKAFDIAFDPTGSYAYVVEGTGRISVFSVAGGSLTELASSPVSLPAGVTPFGIVVN